jgi:hypothetical protein
LVPRKLIKHTSRSVKNKLSAPCCGHCAQCESAHRCDGRGRFWRARLSAGQSHGLARKFSGCRGRSAHTAGSQCDVLSTIDSGDGRTAEARRPGSKASRRTAQRAVAVAAAAAAAAEALALAERAAAAEAEAVAELRSRQGPSVSARGRARKLAPSDGWQTTAVAVARRVV